MEISRPLQSGRRWSKRAETDPNGVFNTVNWQTRTTAFLNGAHERYGDIWTLKLVGGTTFVMLSEPKLIREVLSTDPEVLHAEARLATQLVGESSVLVTQGKEHDAKRDLLEPFFNREHVENYRPEIARIRGVAAESVVAGLLERGLIAEAGREETGAVRYRTTPLFERVFGLENLAALPRLDDLGDDAAAIRARLEHVADRRGA